MAADLDSSDRDRALHGAVRPCRVRRMSAFFTRSDIRNESSSSSRGAETVDEVLRSHSIDYPAESYQFLYLGIIPRWTRLQGPFFVDRADSTPSPHQHVINHAVGESVGV